MATCSTCAKILELLAPLPRRGKWHPPSVKPPCDGTQEELSVDVVIAFRRHYAHASTGYYCYDREEWIFFTDKPAISRLNENDLIAGWLWPPVIDTKPQTT